MSQHIHCPRIMPTICFRFISMETRKKFLRGRKMFYTLATIKAQVRNGATQRCEKVVNISCEVPTLVPTAFMLKQEPMTKTYNFLYKPRLVVTNLVSVRNLSTVDAKRFMKLPFSSVSIQRTLLGCIEEHILHIFVTPVSASSNPPTAPSQWTGWPATWWRCGRARWASCGSS